MIRIGLKSQFQPSWRLLLGLLCLALVVFGSIVQVAHSHPGGDLSHSDCSLCATAHVVAEIAANPAPIPATLVAGFVAESIPAPRRETLPDFALFTRPPPASSTLRLAVPR